jgi:hypothetical protein
MDKEYVTVKFIRTYEIRVDEYKQLSKNEIAKIAKDEAVFSFEEDIECGFSDPDRDFTAKVTFADGTEFRF